MTDNLDVAVKVCPRCGGREVKSFCPDCGYHWHEREYTVKSLVSEWVYKGISDIRLFLFTSFDLFRRPEKVIHPFFNKTQSAYYQPVSYLLLVISLYALGAYLFHKPDPESAVKAQLELYEQMGREYSQAARNLQLEYIGFIQQHLDWFFLGAAPFVALSFWLMFRKRGHHYGQMLVFSCYTYAAYYLLLLPRAFFHDPFNVDQTEVLISTIAWFVLFTWFIHRVFQKKLLPAFLLSIWSYVLYFTMFFSAIIVLVILGVMGILVVSKTTGWNPFEG